VVVQASVVQASDIFICEPFNYMVLPTASTFTTLESGEHVEILDGMCSHFFKLEYGYLYILIYKSNHKLSIYSFISRALN
jgi:hypothetical protein